MNGNYEIWFGPQGSGKAMTIHAQIPATIAFIQSMIWGLARSQEQAEAFFQALEECSELMLKTMPEEILRDRGRAGALWRLFPPDKAP